MRLGLTMLVVLGETVVPDLSMFQHIIDHVIVSVSIGAQWVLVLKTHTHVAVQHTSSKPPVHDHAAVNKLRQQQLAPRTYMRTKMKLQQHISDHQQPGNTAA